MHCDSLRALISSWLLVVSLGCASSSARPPDSLQTEAGFVPLFDGKSFDGWQGAVDHYTIEAGAIVYRPDVRTKTQGLKDLKLLSGKEYGDFVLRFEFKLTEHSNSGIGVRAPVEGDAAFEGLEIQIIDNPRWKNLKPFQVHGSVYGVVPAKVANLKPLGEWNSEEIVCQGSRVKVTVNGDGIVDANLAEIAEPTIDGRAHPGLKRLSGHIALLGHTGRVEFRNLRLKEL